MKRHPIPVTEIVAALERESANTDSDPKWLAAEQLRRMTGWETRTLMCRVDERPSTIESPEETPDEPTTCLGIIKYGVCSCGLGVKHAGKQPEKASAPCGNPVMINAEWYGPCTLPSGHEGDCKLEHSVKGLASAGSSAAVNPREIVGGSAEPSGRPAPKAPVPHEHLWSTDVDERLVHCLHCGFYPLGPERADEARKELGLSENGRTGPL